MAGAGQKSSWTFITKVYILGFKLLAHELITWLHDVIHSNWPVPVPFEVEKGGVAPVIDSSKVAQGGFWQGTPSK